MVFNTTSLSDKNRTLGKKKFEMTNHLGNVLSVISDRKLILNNPVVIGDQPNQKAFANKGLCLYLKQEYTKSILSYTESLNLSTKDGEVLFRRGLSFLKIHNNESASQDFKNSYDLGFSEAHNMIKQYCPK